MCIRDRGQIEFLRPQFTMSCSACSSFPIYTLLLTSCSRAVSYTHLDVYKRQAIAKTAAVAEEVAVNGTVVTVFDTAQFAIALARADVTADGDVYKRQTISNASTTTAPMLIDATYQRR